MQDFARVKSRLTFYRLKNLSTSKCCIYLSFTTQVIKLLTSMHVCATKGTGFPH